MMEKLLYLIFIKKSIKPSIKLLYKKSLMTYALLLFPLDLKKLKLNHSKYSFLLNDRGGVIDDLIITKKRNGFLIILNAACKDKDIKQISKYTT